MTKVTVEEVLTPRQLELYRLEQEGLRERDICERLALSRTFVKDTLARAHSKLRKAGLE